MKGTLIALLGFLLLAASIVRGQFIYTINSGTITITGYSGPGGVVTIPNTISGLPVTGIGDSAFALNQNLAGVIIPDSVTNLGNGAFHDCYNLTNVSLGHGVSSIGGGAFLASSLNSVIIPPVQFLRWGMTLASPISWSNFMNRGLSCSPSHSCW